MTVRVANDFKTEAQQQLANLLVENKTLKEKNRALEGELTKAKGIFSFFVTYASSMKRICRTQILILNSRSRCHVCQYAYLQLTKCMLILSTVQSSTVL
jgi:hypothetical protein